VTPKISDDQTILRTETRAFVGSLRREFTRRVSVNPQTLDRKSRLFQPFGQRSSVVLPYPRLYERGGSAIARSNKIRSTDKSANFVSLDARARDVQSAEIAPLGYYSLPGIPRGHSCQPSRLFAIIEENLLAACVSCITAGRPRSSHRRRGKESPWKGSRPRRAGEKK